MEYAFLVCPLRLMGTWTGHRFGDGAGDPLAIETPCGLLTACLRATGRMVYPVNPMAVARYRDRHSVAGRKSGHGDAVVLANILRTGLHAYRPLPAGTELAQATAVLARAQQDAVWARTGAHKKLRSHLREYDPAFLAAFADTRGGISRPQARAILAAAPTPAAAAKLISATGTPPSVASVTVGSAGGGCPAVSSWSSRRCSLMSLSAGKAACRRPASRASRCSALMTDLPFG